MKMYVASKYLKFTPTESKPIENKRKLICCCERVKENIGCVKCQVPFILKFIRFSRIALVLLLFRFRFFLFCYFLLKFNILLKFARHTSKSLNSICIYLYFKTASSIEYLSIPRRAFKCIQSTHVRTHKHRFKTEIISKFNSKTHITERKKKCFDDFFFFKSIEM